LVLPPEQCFEEEPASRNEEFDSHSCDVISASFEFSQSRVAYDTGLFVLLFQFRQM